MRTLIATFFALVFFIQARLVHADLVVLIHGYLGSPWSWQESGVVPLLQSRQWPTMGVLIPEPPGILPINHLGTTTQLPNAVYLAQLPSLAPIAIQSLVLEAELVRLGRANPGQSLILIGHSVGGVVARLALVRGQLPKVKALITVASPHLGTPRAEQALDAISDPWPIEVLKDFFIGGPYPLLRNSRDILADLTRPLPGTLLFALNHTQHPETTYISVVRGQPFSFGDVLVPGFSQDMNQIPALAGKSRVVSSPGDHILHPGDGFVLMDLIDTLTKTP